MRNTSKNLLKVIALTAVIMELILLEIPVYAAQQPSVEYQFCEATLHNGGGVWTLSNVLLQLLRT